MDSAVEVKIGLAAEVLRSAGELRFRATGTSMIPAIWPGEVLLVRKDGAATAGPGDVILFGRDGRLCAHRVVRRVEGADGPVWITRGDRLTHEDSPQRHQDTKKTGLGTTGTGRGFGSRLLFLGDGIHRGEAQWMTACFECRRSAA
jgi:hypothetical protein